MAVAENWVDYVYPNTGIGGGTNNEHDRVTKFEYNGLGGHTKLIAVNATSGGTVNQETKYLYEDDYNASLVTNTIYPDSSDTTSSGTDQIKVAYHLDGRPASYTDQREVTLEYTYNDRLQLEYQKATAIPASVYGGSSEADAVRTIRHEHDDFGRMLKVTSYNSTSTFNSGTTLNQIAYHYNSYGKMDESWQDHSGEVDGSTPSVQYAYDATLDGSRLANALRLKSTTYPNGRVIHHTYGSADAISDRLSRIEKVQEDSMGSPGTTLASYGFTGGGRLAVADYEAVDVKLDLFQGTRHVRRLRSLGPSG